MWAKHWSVAFAHVPNRDQTYNLHMCPEWNQTHNITFSIWDDSPTNWATPARTMVEKLKCVSCLLIYKVDHVQKSSTGWEQIRRLHYLSTFDLGQGQLYQSWLFPPQSSSWHSGICDKSPEQGNSLPTIGIGKNRNGKQSIQFFFFLYEYKTHIYIFNIQI